MPVSKAATRSMASHQNIRTGTVESDTERTWLLIPAMYTTSRQFFKLYMPSRLTAQRLACTGVTDLPMSCVPSVKISGSTIGTSPFSWQMTAYLARPYAFSWMACIAAVTAQSIQSGQRPVKQTLIHKYTHELLMHVYASMSIYQQLIHVSNVGICWVHNMLSGQVTA